MSALHAMISSMSGPSNFVVRAGRPRGGIDALARLVLAWARDSRTGEPLYILEIGPEHTGAQCGCECPSCGLPLTAVNAAKTEFKRRPHFRHPEGAERNECLVLAARAAALKQLQEDGWLDLPRQRRSGRVAGLSGEFHEAWVEAPAERLHISQVDFQDRTAAILTFDDGRQLRVELTGGWGSGADPGGAGGSPVPTAPTVPTIWLDVDDAGLAAMDPAELRKRLTLIPDALCWWAHWDDANLQASADAAARERALFYFDELPDGLELPADMEPALKRETVLHHEVKRLLEESRRLQVPGLLVEFELPSDEGLRRDTWASQACELELAELALERRFGRIVPDVTCQAWPAGGNPALSEPLFIEVTVTNVIGPERIARIRQAGQPTLEIDLSLAGGRVTRDGLRRLVIDELATKRWLFHPWRRSGLKWRPKSGRQRCVGSGRWLSRWTKSPGYIWRPWPTWSTPRLPRPRTNKDHRRRKRPRVRQGHELPRPQPTSASTASRKRPTRASSATTASWPA